MFEKVLNTNYKVENVQIILENSLLAAIAANLLAPILLAYLTQNVIATPELFSWLLIHIIVFFVRVSLIQKTKTLLKQNNSKYKMYFQFLLAMVFFSPLLYTYLIWVSMFNAIEPTRIFLIAVVIVTISAGAISTLIAIFEVYVIFILISMVSLISAVLSQGEEMFYILASILTLFSVIIIKAGHKQALLIKNLNGIKKTFETIYETSSDGIVLIKNRRFIDCNSTVLRMFEFHSKEEFLLTHVSQFMPKYQADGSSSMRKMLEFLDTAMEDDIATFEWQFQKRSGEIFWVDFVLKKVLIDDEEILHGVYRDITKKKELEMQKDRFQELLKQQVAVEVGKNRDKDKVMFHQSRLAQMGEMMSMIAHQWRQPLTAISAASGYISLRAKSNKLESEKILKLSEKITGFSQHLSDTIDDFRNFFKENKLPEESSFEEIVRETQSIIDSSLESKNIQLVVDVKERCNFVSFKNELKQVLLNLLKNAEDVLLEKRVQNPTITLTIEGMSLSVADNAGGIDASYADKIFEPYFSTKIKKDGTGLGLYMSKTIVEEHCGGKLEFHNAEEGAVFTIKLQKKQI